jgi:flagellar assembly protein FliH
MLRRLAQTIEELQALRGNVIQRTERQVVELALAIAKRIVLREVSLDPELLVAMARVALDRLADTATASIHLHPDDHAAAVAPRAGAPAAGASVQIVADPSVRRGGCVVRSDIGAIDVAVGAQLDEIAQALFGDGSRGASTARQSSADAVVRA